MQSVSSRIWTRVAESISYDDNDYTTVTSKAVIVVKMGHSDVINKTILVFNLFL